MQITVTVKQLGKKRPVLTQKILEIEELPEKACLEHLIANVVKQQVAAFNAKIEAPEIISFLVASEIDDKATSGKVGFQDIYNTEKADEKQAIENALLAFKDGIYCVFINENQIENLTDTISLTSNCTITFVRLTFLTGSFW